MKSRSAEVTSLRDTLSQLVEKVKQKTSQTKEEMKDNTQRRKTALTETHSFTEEFRVSPVMENKLSGNFLGENEKLLKQCHSATYA